MAKFEKGNPGGFLKMQSELAQTMIGPADGRRDVVQLARKYTKSAVQALVRIMRDPNAQAGARVSAAKLILDRGWGAAEKVTDLLSGMNDAQLVEAAKQIVHLAESAKQRAIAGGTRVTVLEGDGSRTLHSDEHLLNAKQEEEEDE